MVLEVFDMWTIGSEGLFNDNGLEMGEFPAKGDDEPFGGIAFTIIFSVPSRLSIISGASGKTMVLSG